MKIRKKKPQGKSQILCFSDKYPLFVFANLPYPTQTFIYVCFPLAALLIKFTLIGLETN